MICRSRERPQNAVELRQCSMVWPSFVPGTWTKATQSQPGAVVHHVVNGGGKTPDRSTGGTLLVP